MDFDDEFMDIDLEDDDYLLDDGIYGYICPKTRKYMKKYAFWLHGILSCPECHSPVDTLHGRFGDYVGCTKVDCFWTGREPRIPDGAEDCTIWDLY